MQLAPTTFATAQPTRPVTVLRPGGPGAQPTPAVVAQAVVRLPLNFGATAAVDVTAGYTLGSHATLEDARRGARELAAGTGGTLGIVRAHDGDAMRGPFLVVDLLVPDFVAMPQQLPSGAPMPGMPGWDSVRPTSLVLGRDSALGSRSIDELWAHDREGGRHLVEVVSSEGAAHAFVPVDGGRYARTGS